MTNVKKKGGHDFGDEENRRKGKPTNKAKEAQKDYRMSVG